MSRRIVLVLLVLACAGSAGAKPESIYLPPADARGGRWCFDPHSARLATLLIHPHDDPADQLDAQALAADLDDLQELLRTSYPGYAVLAQSPTFDVNAFFRRWRASLAGKKTVRVADGLIAPFRTLREEVIDKHLSPWVGQGDLVHGTLLDVHEYQAALAAGASPSLASCSVDGARRVYGSTLRLSQTLGASGLHPLVTVSAAADGPLTLRCGDQRWTLAERADQARPAADDHALPYTWSRSGDTVIIRIRRLFGSTAVLQVLAQLPKDYAQHAGARRIVFDLRGNGGGDDGYVYDWIAQAKDGVWFSGAETRRQGALFPCFDWNLVVQRQVMDATVGSAAAKAERDAVQARWPARAPDEHEQFDDGLIHDHAAHPYHGRIYVLEDRHSASSGESAGWVLQQALGATVLGERTGGYSSYGNLRLAVLPRSGVPINVPTKRNWFNTPMEAVGIPIDIYLDESDAPVSEILPLLDRLEKRPAAHGSKGQLH